MRLIEAQKQIESLGLTIFTTNDIATSLQITTSHASVILRRLTTLGVLINLKRGKWCIVKKLDPLILPEYVTAPFPSYISLQSALYYHGMISQIPHVIYAVSLARTQKRKINQITLSIHHIQPHFFFGYTIEGTQNIKLATPEKALIDYLYLSPSKSHLFSSLPEIELPDTFNAQLALEITHKIPSIRRRSMTRKRLEDILASAN